MQKKILQLVGWFGLIFALIFVFFAFGNRTVVTSSTQTSLAKAQQWMSSEEWSAIQKAGYDQCTLSVTTTIPYEVRVGARQPIKFDGSLKCPEGNNQDNRQIFLLRLQGPADNIQPRGEINSRSGQTVWTITGTDNKNWQGTLRVDLLAGDLPISVLAAPIDIDFVKFMGLNQSGVIILSVLLFLGPIACIIISARRKK